MNNIKVSFIGGGKRMFYCAEELGKHGMECAIFGFDNISAGSRSTRCRTLDDCLMKSSVVILPVPLSKDGVTLGICDTPVKLCDIFAKIPKEAPVFAGAVTEKARDAAKEYNIEIYDYLDDESLAEKNAVATAEGAIYLMMQNFKKTILDSTCLVSGYGRIGAYTAKLLGNLGAKVTVLARREISRTKAILDGKAATDINSISDKIGTFDFIINTVPAEIFTEKELSRMSSHQIYIELASAPYGINKRKAEKYNIEVVDGSALPSRYCPQSSGEYICEKLLHEFERSGII